MARSIFRGSLLSLLLLCCLVGCTYTKDCQPPQYASGGQCVDTCPVGEYGYANITSGQGQCRPLPANFSIYLNATHYFADITVPTTQPGTPVINFTILINTSFIDSFSSITFSVVNNAMTTDVFNLGGTDDRTVETIFSTDLPAFDPTTTSTISIRRSIFYNNALPIGTVLPVTYNFDMNAAILFNMQFLDAPSAAGEVFVRGLCEPNPCSNGGTCSEDGSSFSCMCANGYAGDKCEEDLSFCDSTMPCLNGGFCLEGPGTSTSCLCPLRYTGSDCSIEVDICATDPNMCQNGGTCMNNAMGGATCDCPNGFNGTQCEFDVIFCHNDTCMNGGTCMERPGDEIVCVCASGYTGSNCEVDMDFCQTSFCMNGGICVEGAGSTTTCDCIDGFSGPACQIDLDFCRDNTCSNGGTCNEGYGKATNCSCLEGFTGEYCEIDIDFCQDDTCLNNGTCMEGIGTATSCSCIAGFSGAVCDTDLDFCEPDLCFNGGICMESIGVETICTCSSGYSGVKCETDLDFCQDSSCVNGGTCIEGEGTLIICNCLYGYAGVGCSLGLGNCSEPGGCLNGGECVLLNNSATACVCAPGFNGTRCGIIIPEPRTSGIAIPLLAFWIIIGVGSVALLGIVVLLISLFVVIQWKRSKRRQKYTIETQPVHGPPQETTGAPMTLYPLGSNAHNGPSLEDSNMPVTSYPPSSYSPEPLTPDSATPLTSYLPVDSDDPKEYIDHPDVTIDEPDSGESQGLIPFLGRAGPAIPGLSASPTGLNTGPELASTSDTSLMVSNPVATENPFATSSEITLTASSSFSTFVDQRQGSLQRRGEPLDVVELVHPGGAGVASSMHPKGAGMDPMMTLDRTSTYSGN